jgi:ATP-dependent Clp protease ATP-binding subunit ClpB
MFTPLNEREIEEIVGIQVNGIKRMLAKNGVELEVTPAALSYLAKEGYNPEFGARPVKRVIQRMVLNRLSKDILAQKVNRESPIIIDENDGELIFRN